MIDITSKDIDTVSCSLHFLEAGNPEGKDVILLHGMKFKAESWQELGTLEKLATAGYHPLALDMPGFGGSPACEADQDKVLADFINELELERPVLIGPSMGGRIALEFALNHPGIQGGLVLVGTVGVAENKDRLSQIEQPVFIVWGGDDQISPIANSDILLNSIKGSKRLVLEGAPHPCYQDQPDAWHAALLEFLATV
ncbi:MAG: alpha/beta hydrolase [Deltaproteobacteria bacterium]|nr:alpha/beta hydrolase [Deltaproteobacteria bacterium]